MHQKYTFVIAILIVCFAHFQSFSQVIDKAKLLQFEEAITRGEEFLQSKDYSKAKEEYQKALAIDPSAKYPKDKLAQIRKVYTDPKDEINFQTAISKGDQLYSEGNFSAAKGQYSLALLIKPDDKSTREKVVNADKKAVEKAAMLQQYEALKTEGDKLFTAKEYSSAIVKYKDAQALNPEDDYTPQRISEAESIMLKQQQLDDNYNSIIGEADEAYMNRNYDLATAKYKQASQLKPNENYPKSMLERVVESAKNRAVNDAEQEKLLAEKHKQDSINAEISARELAEKEAETARIKAIQDAEDAKILAEKKAEEDKILADKKAEEDRILAEKQKEEDRILAEKKAEEDRLSMEKLNEEKRLADKQLAAEQKLAAEKEAEAKRLALEKEAEDSKLALEKEAEEKRLADIQIEQQRQDSIASAKTAFELAQKQAEEAKLAEQERIAEQERLAEETRLAEKAKIESELASQTDKEYYAAIESANQLFKEEDFTSAIVMYEKASALKPMEEYPKDRLLVIHNIQLERLKNNLEAYNKNIAAGDLAYQSNMFDKAIEEYEKASIARPEETYPGLMIEKIRKLMEENAMISLVTSATNLTDASEQKYKFNSVEMKLRKNNYIVIKARKTSEKAPKIFINYGKDDIKSGGVAIKSIESEEEVNYLVRISSQDKWYRVDNNWISLYPEGGSIEILSMQISQGDIQKVQ